MADNTTPFAETIEKKSILIEATEVEQTDPFEFI